MISSVVRLKLYRNAILVLLLSAVNLHSQYTANRNSLSRFCVFDCGSYNVCLESAENIIGLTFSQLRLKKLPKGIEKFTNLTELDLSSCEFDEFPKIICKMEKLECLNLANNYLKKIPEEISNCKRLKRIFLSNNLLASLPNSLLELKDLEIITLDGNTFKEFPEVLTQISNLVLLDVSNNKIQSIPTDITRLAKLEDLFLSNNPITDLPENVFELPRLNNIYLVNIKVDSTLVPANKNTNVILTEKTQSKDWSENYKIGPIISMASYKSVDSIEYNSLPIPEVIIEDNIIYPILAFRAGVEGDVIIQFCVDDKGTPENFKIIEGRGAGLEDEAIAAIKNIKFKPATLNEEKIKCELELTIKFELKSKKKSERF